MLQALRFATAFLGACLSSLALAGPPQGYQLNWSDEFTSVNAQPYSGAWHYDLGGGGWGNGEWQTYVNSWANSHVIADSGATDGQAMQIRVEKDGAGNYYSARFNSAGQREVQYGYIEMRAKLPWSKGMWPAFWMLGTNIGSAGWPGCGEIDILENIGTEQGISHSTLHGPGYSGGSGLTSSYYLPSGWSFAQGYHSFGVLWLPDLIQFDVDGNVFFTRTPNDTRGNPWVFNHPFFFILNCAVGGSMPGNPDGSTITPMNYLIDYVRVYKPSPIPYNSYISLRSLANNKYVCAENAGQAALTANRSSVGAWEKFQVINAGGGMVALKSMANQKYVTAENGGGSALIANRSSIGTWEKFEWVDFGNYKVALKANANWRYVCADNAGASPLIANKAAVGTWESFNVAFYPNGSRLGDPKDPGEDDPWNSLASSEKPLVAVPNPAKSFADAAFRLDGEAKKVVLAVLDISGQQLSQLDLGPMPRGLGRAHLDLQALAPGVYVVVLSADYGVGLAPRGTFKLAIVK